MIIIEINLIFRIAETYMNDVDHLYTAFAPADDFTIVTVKCFFLFGTINIILYIILSLREILF